MPSFNASTDVKGPELKPRLLRFLLRELVPGKKRQLGDPSDVSRVVSVVRTHGLLSESEGGLGEKLAANWKSAVDDWVDRLMNLIPSDMPDRSWAGVCLLGVTCQECSFSRFSDSYSSWFEGLIKLIQVNDISRFVRVASFVSLSDLFVRLGHLSSGKKDGAIFAGRLIQPTLKLLIEDGSEALWDAGMDLFSSIINSFPSAFNRQYYDSVESTIASKIIQGKCSTSLSKKLAYCLAALPRSKGDEETWSLLMLKILLSVNRHLDDIFRGLEEEFKSEEAVRLLVPPGKDPPHFLGCEPTLDGVPAQDIKGMSTSSACALIICCCEMLTNAYPVPVYVPVASLLVLAERVLMVDGSVPRTSSPFVTAMQQESLCLDLPVLHSHCLELLIALNGGMRSLMLPHAPYVGRLIERYSKKCIWPEQRINLYAVMKTFLISMGVGTSIFLSKAVISNALKDLSLETDSVIALSSTLSKASEGSQETKRKRKRKHAFDTGNHEAEHDLVDKEVQKLLETVPASVRIAALEALETLLTVGGALKSETWKPQIDDLLIDVASSLLENEAMISLGEGASASENLQLASLKALLASILSQTRARPAHLSKSLELYRRGRKEVGTKVGEFCAHALLTLEVLIHPRGLLLTEHAGATMAISNSIVVNKFNIRTEGPREGIVFGRGSFVNGVSQTGLEDDYLHREWIENVEADHTPKRKKSLKSTSDDPSAKHSIGSSSGKVEMTPLDRMDADVRLGMTVRIVARYDIRRIWIRPTRQ
ncbi:hypothetical protein MLD38_009848 [Melastoma candidum]|uniref:Uncharacterized protein n=1 Tax=Melastoma candidum TaxID=119954 RepID=A0ACB9S1X5_9MYRT|nr:hypothetical protein MLD38_009848 [Melastoma candidum]